MRWLERILVAVLALTAVVWANAARAQIDGRCVSGGDGRTPCYSGNGGGGRFEGFSDWLREQIYGSPGPSREEIERANRYNQEVERNNQVTAYNNAGVQAYNQGRYQDALSNFIAADNLYSTPVSRGNVAGTRAMIAYLSGNFALASQYVRQALSQSDAPVWRQLAASIDSRLAGAQAAESNRLAAAERERTRLAAERAAAERAEAQRKAAEAARREALARQSKALDELISSVSKGASPDFDRRRGGDAGGPALAVVDLRGMQSAPPLAIVDLRDARTDIVDPNRVRGLGGPGDPRDAPRSLDRAYVPTPEETARIEAARQREMAAAARLRQWRRTFADQARSAAFSDSLRRAARLDDSSLDKAERQRAQLFYDYVIKPRAEADLARDIKATREWRQVYAFLEQAARRPGISAKEAIALEAARAELLRVGAFIAISGERVVPIERDVKTDDSFVEMVLNDPPAELRPVQDQGVLDLVLAEVFPPKPPRPTETTRRLERSIEDGFNRQLEGELRRSLGVETPLERSVRQSTERQLVEGLKRRQTDEALEKSIDKSLEQQLIEGLKKMDSGH